MLLVADPNFLALAKLQSGQPTSSPGPGIRLGRQHRAKRFAGPPRSNDEQLLSQPPAGRKEFGSPMEALIPDPAIYKFETGTGFEISPVIQPDGQSVVFHLDYMYTTNVREPVRADEKHLGRIKRHFIDTDVQLGNYELREVSRYLVALKASRTSRGVPLLEDIPALGILFRPLPSASSVVQQNVILGQSTIFPTLFDLMGLRIAPAIADLDTLRMRNSEFLVRGRARDVSNRVFDYSTSRVDDSSASHPPSAGPTCTARRRLSPTSTPTATTARDSTCTIASCRKATIRRERIRPLSISRQSLAKCPTTPCPVKTAVRPELVRRELTTTRPQPRRIQQRPAPPRGSGARADAAAPTLEPATPAVIGPGISQRSSSSPKTVSRTPAPRLSRSAIPMPVTRGSSSSTARVAAQQPGSRPSTAQVKPPRTGTVTEPRTALARPRATSPRTTDRPVTDPATVRASAVVPEKPPAKPARKSVLSRIFNPDN